MSQLNEHLQSLVDAKASDLYLVTGTAPTMKVQGSLAPLPKPKLTCAIISEFVNEILDENQKREFEAAHEMNLALSLPGIGRFRVNLFYQRNDVAIVMRNIKLEIPSIESLNLPSTLKELVMCKHGLILFVGATGTGKSTSLASIIDYRNENSTGHIITVEDPIEYLHGHKKSIITQREIGMDTDSYTIALKNTLRQAPDVILIGEIRDHETMKHAIAFSETGHLCLSTLHASNANQALERIMYFFPDDNREQLLLDLSLNLVAIVSQRLIPSVDGNLVPAFEILLGTPLVCELIKRNDIAGLKEAMKKSENQGMMSFDQSLLQLYEQDKISDEAAIHHADSKNDLRIAINQHDQSSQSNSTYFSLKNDDDGSGSERFC